MPRAKSKSTAAASQQETQEDDVPNTQSQTGTQAQRAASAMSREDQERKVNELVQYLLVMDQKKIPVKRQDITKNVMKDHAKAFMPIMAKAKERLSQVFGLDVVELEGKNQKSYMLINKHETTKEEQHLHFSEAENQRTGLVMVVLSAIFMHNNVMHDEQLYSMLRVIGVDVERPHPVFGDVRKLLTQELVRQGYLDVQKQPASEPPAYEYRWGQRAKHEVSKRKCLQFVTEVYGMDDPAQWTSQWADVQRAEGAVANGHATNGDA